MRGRKSRQISEEYVRNLFYYDETSPSFLRWKVERRTGRNGSVLLKSAGDVAGSITGNGYWKVSVDGRYIAVHRIVMTLEGQDVEGFEVDHIDGDRLNNSKGNLRAVTALTNSRNRGKGTNNKTGVTGVCVAKRGKGELYAIAQWSDYTSGKVVMKSSKFSITKHGYDEALRLATMAREQAILKLNKLGYNYSERNGT